MKKILYALFIALMFLSGTVATSCLKDDGPEDDRIIDYNPGCISQEVWDSEVVGKGWTETSSYRVEDEVVAEKDFMEGMMGLSRMHYYFSKDSVTIFYFSDARHGKVQFREPYHTVVNGKGMTFDVYFGDIETPVLSIIDMGTEKIKAFENSMQNSDGLPVILLKTFKPMAQKEMDEWLSGAEKL